MRLGWKLDVNVFIRSEYYEKTSEIHKIYETIWWKNANANALKVLNSVTNKFLIGDGDANNICIKKYPKNNIKSINEFKTKNLTISSLNSLILVEIQQLLSLKNFLNDFMSTDDTAKHMKIVT